MPPELAVALEYLDRVNTLLRSIAEQEMGGEPVPLKWEEFPEDQSERECIHVGAMLGPRLAHGSRWEYDGKRGVDAQYAGSPVGIRGGEPLYPLSAWPMLARAWVAKRG
jgi:hypothetical protein